MRAIKQEITVKSPGILEIHSPELTLGAHAEVIIIIEEKRPQQRSGLRRFIGSGKGCFSNPDEVDKFLKNP